jgi:hypothetical protein
MEHTYTRFPLLLLIACSSSYQAAAQCSPLTNAVADITLVASGIGTDNRSGVAYNPEKQLYYSVNAGSPGYPLDTYNAAGDLLVSTEQGFDYRGAWWNPSTAQFEGNGYDVLGIFVQTIDGVTGYPTGGGTTLFAGAQPDVQSVGALDTDANEIIYYNQGMIHRYSRATNAFLGSYTISNLPVSAADINSNTVVYTGCAGHEMGIYDFTNRALLFIDKTTGSYVSSCQLPLDAPQRGSFGMSFTNATLWLFEVNTWYGYRVTDATTAATETPSSAAFSAYPNPAADRLIVEQTHVGEAYQVYDAAGRAVAQGRFTETRMELSVADLAVGVYELRSLGDKAVSARFVVAR